MSVETFCYVLIGNETGRVKIGKSRNVPQRIRTLQTSAPERVRLVAVLMHGDKVERRLHKRLASHRIVGEWFSPSCHSALGQYLARCETMVAGENIFA